VIWFLFLGNPSAKIFLSFALWFWFSANSICVEFSSQGRLFLNGSEHINCIPNLISEIFCGIFHTKICGF